MVRRYRLSPLAVAAIFLTGCLAGSAVQALSEASLPGPTPIALSPPPAALEAFAAAEAQPLAPRTVRTIAVRSDARTARPQFN